MEAWRIIQSESDRLISGFLNTAALFTLSTTVALIAGCFLAFWMCGQGSLGKVLHTLTNGMRILPFLILAYLVYYGLPQIGLRMDAWTAGFVSMAFYHSAYFAEILRGSCLTLSKGSAEAAYAHGFTPGKTYLRIILPQLLVRTAPLMGNQMIIALKDTALLCIITVPELTAAANAVSSTHFISTEVFILVILLYWIISIALEALLRIGQRFYAKRGFENV